MGKSILTLLFVVFIISMQSCSSDDNETTTQLSIGDFHQGGVIFYLDETGEHGLINSVADQGFDIKMGNIGPRHLMQRTPFGTKILMLGVKVQFAKMPSVTTYEL